MRIRTRLMVYTIPLIVVPIILFGIAAYLLLKQGFEEQIELEGVQLCQMTASRIEQKLDECYANMVVLQSEAVQEWNASARADLAPALRSGASLTGRLAERFATRHSPAVRIRLASADGNLLRIVRGLSSSSPDTSVLTDPVFMTAVATGYGNRSPQQLPVQANGTTSFSAPVFSAAAPESLLGILLLDLDLRFMKKIVEEMSILQPGSYVVFDGGMNIIAASGGADHTSIVHQATLARTASGRPALHGTASAVFDGMYISTKSVKEYIAYKQPVPEERWYIVAARSTSPLQSAFAKTQLVFLLILGAAVGMGVAGTVVMARRITRPIGNLTAAAQRFADGNLTANIPVESPDEIGALTKDLNRMAERLRQLMREQQTNEALLAIGRLSASLVHDLRNPIEGLRLLSTELGKRISPAEPGHEVAVTIHESIERLSSLLIQSLDFSRLTHPVKSQVAVADIVHDATRSIKSGDVRLTVHIDEALPPVIVDAAQLKRVLVNLLQNALEACRANSDAKPPHVLFRVERREQAIRFQVEDNGPGIPPELLDKIYEPFFTTKPDGHGLGLSFARQILKNHGGELFCTTKVGEGTSFAAELPITDSSFTFSSMTSQ